MLATTIQRFALLAGLAVSAAAQSTISAQDATTFALTYGYPLLAFEKVRIVVDVVGVNKWFHFRQLQTPANKAVVKPNVDTLYSAMVYDLSQDDLLISIPEGIPSEQFHLISFFDPFGTNFASLGTLNTNAAGTYRLRARSSAATPDISSGNETKVVETIETSSIYGFILIRWLVNNTNLDALHTWQDNTLNATTPGTSRAPALSSIPRFNSSLTPVDNVIRLLTAFEPYTLPDSDSLAMNVTQTLAIAGIANGTYIQPTNVDLNAANSTAVTSAIVSAAAPSAKVTLNNGWTVANASLIGIYGDNFAFRYAVASGGYLAIRAPNAIYPSWSNGTSATPLGGDFVLGANEAFVLKFSSRPPLTNTGFWSVTAYQDNFLIPNNYSVYAITSERSNITYLDNTTGAFEILVQPADIRPPSNWTGNFLPGPVGGGSLALTLRLYDAQQSLLDGNWQYPEVTRRAAISASSNNSTTPTTTSTASATATTSSATYTGGAHKLARDMAVYVGPLCIMAAMM